MKGTVSRFALLLAASLLLPLCAHAQSFRAYLATYGADTNPCTVGAPCRLLPMALSVIANNGEVWMLDSGNFNAGTVNVTKNVTIQAIPGQVGSIVPVAGAPAMTLAPAVGVTLRNVAMVANAVNPGTDAIQMATGSLTVEESVLQPGNGYSAIYINGAGLVSVHNTTLRGGGYGILANAGATVNVSSSKFVAPSVAGVYATAASAVTTTVSVRNCDFANGPYTAVWSYVNTAGAGARITVQGSSFSGNLYAIVSSMDGSGSAITTVGGSVISGNTNALYQRGTGAVTEVMGDNVVRNNAVPTTGTITTATRM